MTLDGSFQQWPYSEEASAERLTANTSKPFQWRDTGKIRGFACVRSNFFGAGERRRSAFYIPEISSRKLRDLNSASLPRMQAFQREQYNSAPTTVVPSPIASSAISERSVIYESCIHS